MRGSSPPPPVPATGDAAAVATAPCSHRPPCQACPRYGETGIGAAARALLERLARDHGLGPVTVVDGALTGSRHRARLAIRGRVGAPRIGLFEPGTHRVVHVPECRIHHPAINLAAGAVRRALIDTGTTCYSERAGQGLARYLQIVVERASQTMQVVLVGNAPSAEPAAACLEAIGERLDSRLHSLWYNANTSGGNAILGRDFTRLRGPPSVVERFGGTPIHYPPGAFGQNNLDMAERIIGHLRARVPSGARVAEFYAGVGAIGLSLLTDLAALTLNEVQPESLAGLELGLAELPPAEHSKVRVVPGAAGAAAAAADGADVVIADPPRKGLDTALVEWLAARPPQSLLYVSCDAGSLARDTAALTTRGALRLTELTAFNLMPFTEHVETVAVFARS